MKTESEIRKYRDDLKKCLAKPCNCAEGDHAFECFVGGRMMDSAVETLSWVLGDPAPQTDLLAEEMSRGAKPL